MSQNAAISAVQTSVVLIDGHARWVRQHLVVCVEMTSRSRLSGSLLLALLAVGMTNGCGQDVATCASVCPAAPTGFYGADICLSGCTQTEQACASSGSKAAFQLYLTCVSNAGGFPSQPTLDPNTPGNHTTEATSCTAEAATVASECGTAKR
jgi:hypothetical protein